MWLWRARYVLRMGLDCADVDVALRGRVFDFGSPIDIGQSVFFVDEGEDLRWL